MVERSAVMAPIPLDTMRDRSTTTVIVEDGCAFLAAHNGVRSLRIELDAGLTYGQARDAVELARAQGLRCWISMNEVVLRAPAAPPRRIDRRACATPGHGKNWNGETNDPREGEQCGMS